MPLPELTPEEQYLVDYVKMPKSYSSSGLHTWGYLVGAFLVAGFALFRSDIVMMSSAFLFVSLYQIYESYSQEDWTPGWQSLIEKYEAASLEADRSSDDCDPAVPVEIVKGAKETPATTDNL